MEITHELEHTQQVESAMVLLNNHQNSIPIGDLKTLRIASINMGFNHGHIFNERLMRYAAVDTFSTKTSIEQLNFLSEQVKYHNLLIIQLAKDALTNQAVLDFIQNEAGSKQLILCGFGQTAKLALLDAVNIPIIWSADTTELAAFSCASGVFGGLAIGGKLAENISPNYPAGSGDHTVKTRLGYSLPEAVGINSNHLIEPIGQIMREAIAAKATPGGVVMIVKNGEVIFEQAYGFHTYDKQRATVVSDIFDMASVSKITATTLSVMRLTEQKKLDLDQTMGHYLLQARHTNKESIRLRDVMLHQAGFVSFIPFYQHIAAADMRRDSSLSHQVKLADGRFLRTNYYQEVMWPEMLRSGVQKPGSYVYSDISMYVMKEVVERQSSEPIEDYVQEQFYIPLGMTKTGYNPRRRFPKERIVPTENDTSFRDTLLQGFVHDQGAAMAGGVAGHAGVFSTANDLAIYGQLLLNKGTYGGAIYFLPTTVDTFTSKQSQVSRRGLGFDRKDPDSTKGYPSKLASAATFGHTGYTGTCIWIDPTYQLTYIFLSNRVHPIVTNKLLDLNIRSRVQDAIYEAIAKGPE